MLRRIVEDKFLNGRACQNGGFLGKYFMSASIFLIAYEHLSRLFQPSLKYLQVKPIWG